VRITSSQCCLAALSVFISTIAAGCGLTDFHHKPTVGSPVWVTEHFPPSALFVVAGGAVNGQTVSGLVAATERPREVLQVLRPGASPSPVITSSSPTPAAIRAPGKPGAPGRDATSYQLALYHQALTRWHVRIRMDGRAVAARTEAALLGWDRRLGLEAKLVALRGADADHGSLGDECAAAASALIGLQQQDGNPFGSRRVLVLFARSLSGSLNPGELTDDDVIVVTPFLPTSAAASAAQADLLRAGAVSATVLGAEENAGQLARLVTAGLSHRVVTETISQPALFANSSAVLVPSAARMLAPLVKLLDRPGATCVINGYASTPGSRQLNYRLSYLRAAAVANFLEARGVPASAIFIVGHGATGLSAPGASAKNRQVTVVIQQSAAF